MDRRHGRPDFFVVNEGVLTEDDKGAPIARRPSPVETTRKFLFSRMAPQPGARPEPALLEKLAASMVSAGAVAPSSKIPAGFTYLGQFIDHDLTLDKTAKSLSSDVTVEELQQGRSPALDLDSVYGLGPTRQPEFYDGARLKVGTTAATTFPAGVNVNRNLQGFDLPRVGTGQTKGARRKANIPDLRNDENLIVAQVHLAFIRFHNSVVADLEQRGFAGDTFERAREEVVKHYQWMLREDFLPRICDPAIVDDVFTNGRQRFEPTSHDEQATMPIEFSVGAYRLGHSMVRTSYEWNRVFQDARAATLERLFQFSGTSGTLSPDGDLKNADSTGSFERLPTNWVADWRRLFDFPTDVNRVDLAAPAGKLNFAEKINTLLTPFLGKLPPGSFGGRAATPAIEFNLAFRNLMRGRMVALPSGQQMAALFGLKSLTQDDLLGAKAGGLAADLTKLSDAEKGQLADHAPLWFYVLREAEVLANGEWMGPVGSRIVAETLHRSMESSHHSILRDPSWRPSTGTGSFKMAHLLLSAFKTVEELNPLG